MGPGFPARLLEVGDWSGKEAETRLTLFVNASGTSVELAMRVSGQDLPIFQAPISWAAGAWHQIALTWTPGAQTRLFIDGQWSAEGSGWNLPPPTEGMRGFALGSDLVGEFRAQGHFDEVFTFGWALTQDEVASDYERNAARTALGAMSPEEEDALLAATAMALAAQSSKLSQGVPSFATEAAPYGSGLWLEIGPSAQPEALLITLHNTTSDRAYQLWSTESLHCLDWAMECAKPGTAGQDDTEFSSL